jgi:hypothetical protein
MSLTLEDPEPYELQHVLAYKPGSDVDQAEELIVLLAHYDGLGRDPDGQIYQGANHNASGVAMLLEIAQLWQDQNLNPRRPVLFVAWGGGSLDQAGLQDFITDRFKFRHLVSAQPGRYVFPMIVIELDRVGAGGEVLRLQSDGVQRYVDLVMETSAELDRAVITEGETQLPLRNIPSIPEIRLGWAEDWTEPSMDTADQLRASKFQEFGEVISLILAKMVRQTNF